MNEIIIDVTPAFFSQYDELPKAIKKKFKKQLALLKENPKHQSLQIHQLEGTDFWEFYVDKGYRCVFKREGHYIYRLYFIGTHDLIDKF